MGKHEKEAITGFYYRRQKQAFLKLLGQEQYETRLQAHLDQALYNDMLKGFEGLPEDALVLGHKDKVNGELFSCIVFHSMPIGRPFKLNDQLWEDIPLVKSLRSSAHVWYAQRFAVEIPRLRKMEFSPTLGRDFAKELFMEIIRYGLDQKMAYLSCELNVFSFKLINRVFNIPVRQVSDSFFVRWMEKESCGLGISAEEMRTWLGQQAEVAY